MGSRREPMQSTGGLLLDIPQQNPSSRQFLNVPVRSGNIVKFSAQFASQWEKDKSWKFYDIWDLVKLGVTDEIRVNLWRDFLKVSKYEKDADKYLKKNIEGKYRPDISPYQNLKFQTSQYDCFFF